MTKETYKTKDLWEAGALLAENIPLVKIEKKGNTCYFIFGNLAVAEDKVQKYYFGNLLIDAFKYQEAVNRLKKQIYKVINN